MADEYDRYRDGSHEAQAKRLYRDWAQGLGKARLDKDGNVKPSQATFLRYLRSF